MGHGLSILSNDLISNVYEELYLRYQNHTNIPHEQSAKF